MGDVDILGVWKRGAARTRLVLCEEKGLVWADPRAFGGAEVSIFCADSSIRSTQGEINKREAVQLRLPSPAAGCSLLSARNFMFQPQNNPCSLRAALRAGRAEGGGAAWKERAAQRVSAAEPWQGLSAVLLLFICDYIIFYDSLYSQTMLDNNAAQARPKKFKSQL